MSFYQPLDDAADEIRLLWVQPADSIDDALITTLHTVSLRGLSDYLALSYVWGDPQIINTITVNSEPHEVTVNLDSALRHIRLRFKEDGFIIWADALCINQRDGDERATQVSKMTRIFKNASTVIAWFGPATEDSALAVFTIERLIKMTEGAPKGSLGEYARPALETLTPKEVRSIIHLLNRPFTTRRWITQEVISGQAIVMVCGNRVCDLFILFELVAAIVASSDLRIETTNVAIRELSNINAIEIFARWRVLRDLLRLKGTLDVLHALLANPSSHCSDPRDRLYAIIGLSEEASFLRPDYSKSTRDVFLDFAVENMLRTSWLDVITHAHVSQWEEKAQWGLPSWVPVWYTPRTRHLEICPPNIQVPGEAHIRGNCFSVSARDAVLRVKGFIFDTIADYGNEQQVLRSALKAASLYPTGIPVIQAGYRFFLRDKNPYTTEDLLQDDAEFFPMAAGFLQGLKRFMNDPSDEDVDYVESYLEFIDQQRDGRTNEEILGQFVSPLTSDCGKWPDSISLGKAEPTQTFWHQFSLHNEKSTLFLTQRGYLGSVLDDVPVRNGDTVAVLGGLEYPAILRKVDGQWKFLGTCWILHLEGERLYEALDGGRDDVQAVEFDIH